MDGGVGLDLHGHGLTGRILHKDLHLHYLNMKDGLGPGRKGDEGNTFYDGLTRVQMVDFDPRYNSGDCP